MKYAAEPSGQPFEWRVTVTDADGGQDILRVACKSSESSSQAAIDLIKGLKAGDTVAPIAQQRIEMSRAVDRFHADLLTRLTGGASVAEQMTWAPKAAAAAAVLAGNAAPEQMDMLEPEALARGESLGGLAAIISGKNAEFHKLVGIAGSLRVEGHKMVAAAGDAASLATVIPYLRAHGVI